MASKIKLLLFVLTHAILSIIHANANSEFMGHRDLPACSSQSTCSSCNSDSGWVMLDGQWDNNPGLSIRVKPYNPSTGYANWNGATEERYQYLRSHKSASFNLSHSTNTPTLCEWWFVIEDFGDIKVNISKSSSNYEDMFIYISSKGDQTYKYLKDLSDCSSDFIELEFKDVYQIILRVDTLSTKSNYSITLSKSVPEDSLFIKIFIAVIVTIVVIVFMSVIATIWYFTIKNWRKERLNRVEVLKQTFYLKNNKLDWIKNTLETMKNGEYGNQENKFHQEAWVICLEDFQKDSEVLITNECLHVFHHNCIKEWYYNIKFEDHLTCPHCKTINEPAKEGYSNSIRISKSIHLHNNTDTLMMGENNLQLESIMS